MKSKVLNLEKELIIQSSRHGSFSIAWKNLTTPVYPHDHPYLNKSQKK